MGTDLAVESIRIHCSWCNRVRECDDWVETRMSRAEAVGLSEQLVLAHGICPGCFAELAPHTPYPTA